MATSKLPLAVSITVAVVRTRVWPRMLPPTIIDAPISEMTPPKPAITAASIGRRSSRTSSHRSCPRDATSRATQATSRPSRSTPTRSRTAPRTPSQISSMKASAADLLFRLARDGHEERLPVLVHAEDLDDRLGRRRDHEVGEGLAADRIHARAVGRVHFHHRVDVEERPVLLDQDRQRDPLLKGEER